MKATDWAVNIEENYTFAKKQRFKDIRLVIETNDKEYEIYERESGFACDVLSSSTYYDICEIAGDLCNMIETNGDEITDIRIG